MEKQQESEYFINKELTAERIKQNSIIGPYKFVKRIGGGSFGTVYLAIQISSGLKLAIKIIDTAKFKSQEFTDIKNRLVCDEVTHLQRCKSEHVVGFIDTFYNENIRGIVMEYCRDGSLVDELNKRRDCLSQQQTLKIGKQIFHGLQQLHNKNITHRDIKPGNILIHEGKYKLSDLGFCKFQTLDLKGTDLGTWQTKAPEIILKKEYGHKVDIWAVGVTLFRTAYGYYPFNTENKMLLLNIIQKPLQYKKTDKNNTPISSQFRNFLAQLIEINPEKRLSCEQALDHKIFKKVFNNLPPRYISEPSQIDQNKSSTANLRKTIYSFKSRQKTSIDKVYPFSQVQKKLKFQPQQEKISKPQSEKVNSSYIKTRQQHFNCLKAQFILDQILLKIIKYGFLDQIQRKQKQFMYLLASRCFIYFSYFKDFENKAESQQLKELRERVQTKGLSDKIQKIFMKYDQILFNQENKAIEIVKDRIKNIFNSTTESNKKIVMNGIQTKDYELQQHLELTQDYIKYIINQCLAKRKSCLGIEQLIVILRNYKAINLISCQQTYANKSVFYVEVRKLIGENLESIVSNYSI